jgi:hypothetical protein
MCVLGSDRAGPDDRNQKGTAVTKSYQRQPCSECPWRTDVPPGQFPPERFIALADTAYDMAIVQFACHKSCEGDDIGCAGFALRGATHNLGVRLAARDGRLDLTKIASPYHLYPHYRAVAVANGVPANHPALSRCRDDQ